MAKSIYDLELHEPTIKGVYTIIRVPGGWIYQRVDVVAGGKIPSMVFVPYSDEFNAPA